MSPSYLRIVLSVSSTSAPGVIWPLSLRLPAQKAATVAGFLGALGTRVHNADQFRVGTDPAHTADDVATAVASARLAQLEALTSDPGRPDGCITITIKNVDEGTAYLDLEGLERHYPGPTPELDLGRSLMAAADAAGLPARSPLVSFGEDACGRIFVVSLASPAASAQRRASHPADRRIVV